MELPFFLDDKIKIVCINSNNTINITQNKIYKPILVHKSIDEKILIQIVDDDNYICSYEIERFLSIPECREERLSKILNNKTPIND